MAAAIFLSKMNIPRSFSRISVSLKRINGITGGCHQRFFTGTTLRNVRPQQYTFAIIRAGQSRVILPVSTQYRHFQSSSVFYGDSQIVKTPPFADSISEGDVRWDKEVGDSVEEDEVIGEVETDKTSIPIHAPCAGVIEAFLVEDGSTVVAGQELLTISTSGGAPASTPKAESPAPAAPSPAPATSTPPTPPSEAPPAPQPAAVGPIPTIPPPVPPLPTGPMSSIPASKFKATPVGEQIPSSGAVASATTREETRVKMNRMRQRIAQRLKEAQNTTAMLTTFNEIDMSNIMEMRTKYKEAFLKKHGIKLGFMSAFIKASAFALTEQPVVNGVIDDLDIVYRDYVDISVAVATPKGLVVPVLRDVQNMNYFDIEKGLVALGEKARDGNLAIEDMDGGTFTISNGGVFGSLMGTPIINPPQSAILGMHGVFDRPVAINGKVEIRPMMYVALTYDHRLIDGREAVTFLRKVKSAVEDPRVLLLDL